MKISVIIPVLDERQTLPRAIESVSGDGIEVIVVDGGSSDGTLEWLQSQSGVRALQSVRGRGRQAAAGAAGARGDVLFFLHADCAAPADFARQIEAALGRPDVAGGAFPVRFGDSDRLSLRATAAAINIHSRLMRYATGDQGIFVRRNVYERIGGFRDWPLFEDVDLVRRLRREGRFVLAGPRITISARRWLAHGVARTNILMTALYMGYRLGVPPATLTRRFAEVRTDRKAEPGRAGAASEPS